MALYETSFETRRVYTQPNYPWSVNADVYIPSQTTHEVW